ncbi:hypothetical protein QYE76_047619 [Lolium multiflorum]|uniref:Reverse transcriptase Ty1/copia-type domain-containing protein n=1 Tax=Lolium multiflorum TaxID=4521 RepID=A0AAD8TSA0_LOLMU|nr:hypothetical protein QYE76_047619 [Lolium multiflorum]
MRDLRLWGVISGEVICPSCPTAPTAPIPPTPVALAPDATQEVKDAAKSSDDTALAEYDRKVQEYSVVATYRLDLIDYTRWIDEDARLSVLTSSIWSSAYLSSCRGSARSLSLVVPSCLLVVVFRSLEYVELCAEETHLRGAGLLEVPSVLAARGPPVPSARGPPVPSAWLRSRSPIFLLLRSRAESASAASWYDTSSSSCSYVASLATMSLARRRDPVTSAYHARSGGSSGSSVTVRSGHYPWSSWSARATGLPRRVLVRAGSFGTATTIFYTVSEYISQHLRGVLAEQGTLAQFSCPDAHAQNGVAKPLFVHTSPRERTLLLLYVDDMIITGDDPEYIAFVKAHLRDQFLMTDLGTLRYFLGIEVSSTSDGFSISQEKYIQDLLARAALGDERTVETPMELNVKFLLMVILFLIRHVIAILLGVLFILLSLVLISLILFIF